MNVIVYIAIFIFLGINIGWGLTIVLFILSLLGGMFSDNHNHRTYKDSELYDYDEDDEYMIDD